MITTILLSIHGVTDIKYGQQLDQEFDDVNSPIQGQRIELRKKWNGKIQQNKLSKNILQLNKKVFKKIQQKHVA